MEKYDTNNIELFLKESKFLDSLVGIHNYNNELSISQVVKFFERQGVLFTKTMIQNYVRIGLLPPPADKRHYNKNHLIMLLIIDTYKNIYSLDELKALFDIGNICENKMDVLYTLFLETNKFANEKFLKELAQLTESVSETDEEYNTSLVLKYMELSNIAKKTAQYLLSK